MLSLESDLAKLFPLSLLFPNSCGLHPGFVIFPKARIPLAGAMEASGEVSLSFRFFEEGNITTSVWIRGWQLQMKGAVELDLLKHYTGKSRSLLQEDALDAIQSRTLSSALPRNQGARLARLPDSSASRGHALCRRRAKIHQFSYAPHSIY